MLVVAFCLLAVGPPEAGIELHGARASGDDTFSESLELDLERRQFNRLLVIGSLFLGSIAMTVTGFRSMRGS